MDKNKDELPPVEETEGDFPNTAKGTYRFEPQIQVPQAQLPPKESNIF